jgi:hypothetical protein
MICAVRLLLCLTHHTTDVSVEEPVLSTSKQSEASQIQQQQHVVDLLSLCTVLKEFGPPHQSVNQHYQWDVSKYLREQGLHGNRPSIGWVTKTVFWCTLLCSTPPFAHQKHGWGPLPSLLTWLGPLLISCIYKGICYRMYLIIRNNCWPSCTWMQQVSASSNNNGSIAWTGKGLLLIGQQWKITIVRI